MRIATLFFSIPLRPPCNRAAASQSVAWTESTGLYISAKVNLLGVPHRQQAKSRASTPCASSAGAVPERSAMAERLARIHACKA